jgi:hypothetical protein
MTAAFRPTLAELVARAQEQQDIAANVRKLIPFLQIESDRLRFAAEAAEMEREAERLRREIALLQEARRHSGATS